MVSKPKKTIKIKKNKYVADGQGIIHGNFSFNNTILTLTKMNGDTLAQTSGGRLGFKNTKKSTPYSAQKCMDSLIQIAKSEFGVSQVHFKTKGIGAGRDITLRKIIQEDANQLKLLSLMDCTPQKHGGCRPPKAPRK